jgi:hypothetical protein
VPIFILTMNVTREIAVPMLHMNAVENMGMTMAAAVILRMAA